MARPMPSIFSSCLYSIILTIVLNFVPRFVHSSTLESDIQALISVKRSIDPTSISTSSFLNSWDFKMDPCETSGGNFLGILCTIPLDNSSSRITAIDLDGIGYDGFLTPAIGNLTALSIINLSKNNFRGPIPDTISNLEQLTRLLLSENFFTGSLPRGIRRLKKLEIIDVSQNKLSGSIPATISEFRSLNSLRLSNNEFSGRIPDLNGLWQLNMVDLSTNQLYGNLPKLPKSLNTLSLSHNILSGHISSIRSLENLKTLDLSGNRFSGAISEGILTLPVVTHINVSANLFTTIEVVNVSDTDTQLQVLDAERNRLHSHLPVNLATFENLRTVNLGHNQFSGPIPMEYGAKLWRSLVLDYNFLVGNLPPQFTSGAMRTRGSLANNCLRCPMNIPWCHGGQKPASECARHNSGSG